MDMAIEPKPKRVLASTWLGITGAPYNRVRLLIPDDARQPPPGSPDHKRLADAVIAGIRAENQRAAIHMDGEKVARAYDADAETLTLGYMEAVETLIRDRFGEALANRQSDTPMTFSEVMAEMDAAITEIPSAFREAIAEWRQSNPKARLNAPDIVD